MSEDVLDTHGFTKFVEDLARITGRTFEHVLVDQTRVILQTCLRRTRAAKVGTIVKKVSRAASHIEFEDGHVLSHWKGVDAWMFLDESNYKPPGPKAKKKGTAPKLIKGKSWHEVEGGTGERRWSRARWARYQAYESAAKLRKIDLAAAKASRGVTKASWLQIAADLGIGLDAPAYVKSARPQNGKTYKNGLARKVLESAACYIEIANDHPILVNKLDGAKTLQIAIDSRRKAFAIELEKGVFDDIATRAKRYPGLYVS